ncbi:auxin-responsive family protein [Actinidia rufa]|uniref:Auxin-responsive family protein n=1 Tax=Actinidia rufa TaxID=165716 RepID=A0A7J0FZJ1_9ERIC|nr:auxin-responsive family protein [Actinidia rufa]
MYSLVTRSSVPATIFRTWTLFFIGPMTHLQELPKSPFDTPELLLRDGLRGPSTQKGKAWFGKTAAVLNDSPGTHDLSGANVRSMATLNLLSGQSATTGTTNSKIRSKYIHGVLNTISWGIMMPLGVVIARYVSVFESADPAWFYLHVTCQTSAYIVGVVGWITGLLLGKKNLPAFQHTAHRTIGILLFCLATLQVLSLRLRPKNRPPIQTLLEYLPPLGWVHSHHPKHPQTYSRDSTS